MTEELTVPDLNVAPISSDENIPLKELKTEEEEKKEEEKKKRNKYIILGLALGILTTVSLVLLVLKKTGLLEPKVVPSPSPPASVEPLISPSPEGTSSADFQKIEERISRLEGKLKDADKDEAIIPPVLDFNLEFEIED